MTRTEPNSKSPRPSCQVPPLSAFKIETPATKSGSAYALIPARAVTELSPHAVKMLGVFASLERPSGALRMTAKERMASTGMSKSSFYRARNELIAGGWMDSQYALCDQLKPKKVAASGWYARVQVTKWSVLPAQVCRAMAGLALYTLKNGKGRGSYRIVARFLRISTRTLRRHLAAARNMGVRVIRFARSKMARPILLRLKDVVPQRVRRRVPMPSGSLVKARNSSEAQPYSRTGSTAGRDPKHELERLKAWAVVKGMTMT